MNFDFEISEVDCISKENYYIAISKVAISLDISKSMFIWNYFEISAV